VVNTVEGIVKVEIKVVLMKKDFGVLSLSLSLSLSPSFE
jgi:hypothetical protein